MRPSLYTNFNSIHLLGSRPKTIDDVSAQEHTVAVLQKTLTSTNVLNTLCCCVMTLIYLGQLPHMLFYGPPGTGKTSTILALARQLFGQVFIDTI
jgi:replication factor C subunit 2/4